MTWKLSPAGAILALGLAIAVPGHAQDRHDEGRHDRHGPEFRHDEGRGYGEHWRDGDIRRFHERDFDLWRGGRWYHGPYEGRLGWWWIVGGIWYFYPEPVYPYPDPYLPPAVAAPPAPGAVYYYCPSPPGYYPYLPSCPSGWRMVPAR